jgi:hypothetical protein
MAVETLWKNEATYHPPRIARWTVRAVSAELTLEWRVRGVLRSRRIMHGVARRLERGGLEELEVEQVA